jgi:DNA mismatch repair ATPase MutS
MKAHLMFPDRDFSLVGEASHSQEELAHDLRLSTLFDAMARGDKFLLAVSKRAVLSSLRDPAAIAYRQKVLDDCISQPEIVREMYALSVAAVEEERRIYGFLRPYPSGILRRSIAALELFVKPMKRLRQIADEHADRFRSEGLRTFFDMLKRELDDDYFRTIDDHLRRLKFRTGMLMSAELGTGNKGVHYLLRAPKNTKVDWRERLGIGTRSAYSFEISARDDAGARALSELTDRGINSVANALAQSTDHILSFFTAFRTELGFYVGSLNLHGQLIDKGEPTCTPEPLPWSPPALGFAGLYDACLTLRLPERVVGNDANADGKSLIMITGANSGGKSTLLRSIGVAQLMMQCGMFVPAESYHGSVCEGIFAHFIREEDPTMSSGRLDEELSRMSAIADEITPAGIVLFNESFAATNEREGSEIARQIVRALLEVGIKVLYVTHLFDLADGFHARQLDTALFLRAERGAHGQRSFKLVEDEPLSTSFGEDLLNQLGGLRTTHPAGSGEVDRA